MKRLYAALLLLVLLFGGSLFARYTVTHTVAEIDPILLQAQRCVSDDLSHAAALAVQAQTRYHNRAPYLSVFVSQTVLREIRAAFTDVHTAAVLSDPTEFYAALASLRQRITELYPAEYGGFRRIF